MKTRLLLIIGIIIALGSVATFVIIDMYQSQLEWDKRTDGLDDMRYDLQLQKVLDHCQKKELAEGELVIYYEDTIPFYYYNTTHYIGTNSCQWHLLENHPDSDILCIPGIEKWVSSEAIRNSTHIYDKSTCQWYVIMSSSGDHPVYSIPFGSSEEDYSNLDPTYMNNPNNPALFSNSDSERLQRVLDHCEYQRKLATGEIPERNADGSYNVINLPGLSFQNSTHYIDNNTCEWEYALTDEQIHDRIDVVFGNTLKSWTVFPGGVGPIPPENFTLTKIYKDSAFSGPTLDFEAMLDDKIFVDRCISNDGVWNDFYHDCEGIEWICEDVGGIGITVDLKKAPCVDTGIIDDDPLTIKVCRGSQPVRLSCVFEYEN